MGIGKEAMDLTRAERKARKRNFQDKIRDLPGDSAGELQPYSSKPALREHLGVRKKKYSTKEKTRDVKKDKEKRKRQKTTGGDREVLILGIGNSESDQQSKLSSTTTNSNDGATATSNNAARSIPIVETAIFCEEDKVGKTEKKKTEGVNSSEIPSAENARMGSIENRSARFIVFIGNLPFSTTTKSIKEHFSALKPISVRHLTTKSEPPRSRGCAFVEFEGHGHMETCLKLFHHSTFDDGISPPRKINVELTAGGGGKTTYRQKKIGQKNKKLNEERVRRLKGKAMPTKGDANKINQDDVHPSRRQQVPT